MVRGEKAVLRALEMSDAELLADQSALRWVRPEGTVCFVAHVE